MTKHIINHHTEAFDHERTAIWFIVPKHLLQGYSPAENRPLHNTINTKTGYPESKQSFRISA